ncbi:hypothetical protein C5470_00455 [Photorhabdus stackebrandtii]|uniref:Uncharacterized protein n=1 Tax=Photorhabdus stackebrandtii TaxID=1123042 RepID=A0A7X5TJH9_9GAMM|nr:hypothetical protein [Photorhabdus stackebrandtii]
MKYANNPQQLLKKVIFMKHLNRYEMLFREFIYKEMNTDPAHDINHIMRIVQTSKRLCLQEKANSKVIIPVASYMIVILSPKITQTEGEIHKLLLI